MQNKVFLSHLGIINALGSSKAEVFVNLISGNNQSILSRNDLAINKTNQLASVIDQLPEIPKTLKLYDIRCNRLLLAAYLQIKDDVTQLIQKYGKKRIAVVIGSSTSGINEGQIAVNHYLKNGQYPENFDYNFLEMGTPAKFLAQYLGLESLFFTVSTACSSSSKALISARNLINLGICDAVLVGGSDDLCKLTVNGFNALEATATGTCNPFSKNRQGITLGEGAALFIMTKESSKTAFLGGGESSDAYHITAPDPSGDGALEAMKMALLDAKLSAEKIDYINLHGTGTSTNDSMESFAIANLFDTKTPCGSTKSLTGHTLGAAGITEIGLCWLLLSDLNKNNELPWHIWDEEQDPQLPELNFVKKNQQINAKDLAICMSNSFAFGGSNVSIIIGNL